MTFKPLYQFVLPAISNDGTRNYDNQRRQFEKEASAIAGGFTYLGIQVGGWKDGDRLQREPVYVYQVAAFSQEKELLMATLFKLFPDQKSFMVAEIGLAQFADGPAAVAEERAQMDKHSNDMLTRLATRGVPGAALKWMA